MAKKENIDRREYRRRRRIRNQILAYLFLFVVLLAAFFGIYMGVRSLQGKYREKKQETVSENTLSNETETEAEGEHGSISTPETMDEIMSEVQTEEPAVEEQEDPEVAALLDGMSIEQKVDGLFLVSPEAVTGVATATMAGDGTKDALMKYAVGGIVYSPQNVASKDQIIEMVSVTKSMYHEIYNRDIPVFVVEEGAYNTIAGSATGETAQTAAADLAGDGEQVRGVYDAIASVLTDYGIDGDIAPMASVKTAEDCYLGNRIFSDDADIVSSMVIAALEGLHEDGHVISCMTAFPGEGGCGTDPDRGAIRTEKSLEELKDCELKPYVEGIDAGTDMIMVSNIVAPNAGSGEESCCLSGEIVNKLLREEMGFEGVIVTAPMDQAACTESATPGNGALKAFLAGNDMIYVRNQTAFLEGRAAILGAVEDGTITEEQVDEALKRIYTMELKY